MRFRAIQIPLNFRFEQSNNSGTSSSRSAIVEIRTRSGVSGFGESCPRTYVTGESMEDVAREIGILEEELLRTPIESLEALHLRLQAWAARGIGPSTRCALELAWLDAWSRSESKSLRELLGISYSGSLQYSLILPFLSLKSMEKLLPLLQRLQPAAIKLKVGTDQPDTIAKIDLLRNFFGEDMPIRFDVNGAWDLDQARQFIPELLALNIHSFEQPTPPEDLKSLQILTRLYGKDAQIMADESLLDLAGARRLAAEKICNHFNLKISKLGGIQSSLEIYRLARENGIPCQLGAHFGETSILTAAAALLGSLVDGALSNTEGALGELLLAEDIVQPPIQHRVGGVLPLAGLWPEPGLVGKIHPERLEKYTV
ncbi:hypothetical protein CRP01_20175 [Flavilitoribacter nigricans DSM 23189 = NBRC 102662]|uniref:Mandelate racemase/muconate lactonizing enzyme C-terminal domain-containing protein n=1 Tax=Flavilitoribacter nigricans (strain ATCC 23147 / DSM 23189 / NBRC 102662 / NCIMB 1420 / SS-2) TaxID=1122177 RepID=A0A2D0N9K4_FLAN2|nr:hypothetical protein CRP01_20175 [Flavilitoribacter nigricans DSM 23189 = NBRC 102662]